MQVIEYIKENGLDKLAEEFGIKVKDYPEENVVVLNYCQIDSPKTNPIVMECRGLILDRTTYKVLCRPFDRFFNAGESPETCEDFDITRAVAYEKIDGSLIKIWYHPTMGWQAATRGTAFGETDVNGFELTFADLVYKALGVADKAEFQLLCDVNLNNRYTHIFEITAIENRVVRRYEGYKLWYLGCRHTHSGRDMSYNSQGARDAVTSLGAHMPKQFTFESLEHALEASRGLKDLDEGYVLFDKVSHRRIKVKSPAYVAVHRLRGDGLNPKRIRQLVLTNEQAEYLKYFPEDQDMVDPIADRLQEMLGRMEVDFLKYNKTNDQKTFALSIKDIVYSHILFKARAQHKEPIDVFNKLTDNQKLKTFDSYLDEILTFSV